MARRRRPTGPEGRLLDYDRGARRRLRMAVAGGVVGALATVAGAVVLSLVVTAVFQGGDGLPDVLPLLAGAAVLAAVRAAAVWGEQVWAASAAERLAGRLREDVSAHLLALGPSFATTERTGALTSSVVDGLEALEAYLTDFHVARQLAIVMPILVALVVLVLDPPTVAVLVVTGPVLVLLLALIGGRARDLTERRSGELRWMSSFFLDLLQGLPTLRMFGRSAAQAEVIEQVSRRFAGATIDVLRTAFQTALVLEWGAAVAMAIVAVQVSLRLMADAIDFGAALAVLVVTPEFFLPLRRLALRYHAGSAGRTAAGDLFRILDTTAPIRAPRSAPRARVEPSIGRSAPMIVFGAVSLRYPDRDRPALADLDLTFRPDRLTVLTGPSGAGKSSIVAVLMRFVEPDDGSVSVDGVPLADMDPADWRASIGWLPQRPHLFDGSVSDNLRQARPEATMTELREAAAAVGADAFIRRLPGGYDAAVGDRGLRLSGGQRQRLALVRAIVRDPPCLILDEPTEHLDPDAESAVVDALGRFRAGRTTLVVSHRPAILAIADDVVRIEAGRVADPSRA